MCHFTRSPTLNVLFFSLLLLENTIFLIKRNCQYICSFSFFSPPPSEEFGMSVLEWKCCLEGLEGHCVNKLTAWKCNCRWKKKIMKSSARNLFRLLWHKAQKRNRTKNRFEMKLNHVRQFTLPYVWHNLSPVWCCETSLRAKCCVVLLLSLETDAASA